MKKRILLLPLLCLVLSLCACGAGEEESAPPQPDNDIFTSEPVESAEDELPQESPEPSPPPIPSIDPGWACCRGTWVSMPSESISCGMDAYFESAQNYLYLSPDTRGAIVLGGWYREFLYSAEEDKIALKFTDTGEEWTGDIVDGIIYELAPGGGELHYTFILIEENTD